MPLFLTRAQRIARRFGEKQPVVNYHDENDNPVVIVDPTNDVPKETEEKIKTTAKQPLKKTKSKSEK